MVDDHQKVLDKLQDAVKNTSHSTFTKAFDGSHRQSAAAFDESAGASSEVEVALYGLGI